MLNLHISSELHAWPVQTAKQFVRHSFQVKIVIPWKGEPSSAHLPTAFPPDNLHTLARAAQGLCMYFGFCHPEYFKKVFSKVKFSKINNSYCFHLDILKWNWLSF